MQPTAHSSVSSEPEGRRSTKGRSLWRSGGSCPDHANAHANRANYDHDHVFDDRTRGGDYGDQVDPVAADDRDDHDDDFVFDDGVDHHDQFLFFVSIYMFISINIKIISKLLV